MKRMLYLSILTVIIIGFQNCSKMQLHELPKDQTSLSINSPKSSASSFSPQEADKLNIPNSLTYSWTSSEDSDVFYFQLNLTTGAITSFDFNEQEIKNKTYCLTESDMSELKTILNSASVCDKSKSEGEQSGAISQEQESSEKLCTAVYKEPYASLVFGENELKLGESRSGCDEPVDLCGDHKDLLKGFLKNLLNNISTKACSFESVTKR